LNGSNAREYKLALSSGQSFVQIATEGGLLPESVTRSTILIAPGERVEVIIDFSPYAMGSQVILKNLLGVGSTADVMRFDVVGEEEDTSSIPSSLRDFDILSLASATRDFRLSFDWMQGLWVINGNPFDPARIDATPRLGATEIWSFNNRSTMAHPMHIHNVMFQILDRNGVAPSPGEAGWKDTVRVGPRERVRVIAKFTDYTGIYVFHCHNLEHEDRMMMGQFQVV
jgi:spore coat protein A